MVPILDRPHGHSQRPNRMCIEATHRCRWLTLCCLWVSTAGVFAAEPPANESGVGGLRLRSSRAGDTWQQELQRAGFTSEAIPRLQPLLEQARDQFLNSDGVSVTGGQLVDQWLQAAPLEQWERWDTSIRNEAQVAWKRWEDSRDEAALRQFLQAYGSSRLGLTGWKALARTSMDEARWDHAAAGLEHVRQHRAASVSDLIQATMELVAVRVRQNRVRDAQRLATSQSELLANQSVRWGGQSQPTAAVLKSLLPNEPLPEAVVSSRPSTSPRSKHPIVLPEELRTYWPEWRRDYRAEGAWLNPIAEPLIVGDRVIVQTIAGLECYPLTEGKEKPWRVAHDDWRRMLAQAEKWGSREWRGQVLDQLVRRESADSVLGRISSDGQRVFAVTGGVGSELDRLIPAKTSNPSPREDASTPGHIENRLSAYDVETGELLWQLGGPSSGPTYRFAQMFFCGPPTIVDGTLYVVAQQDTELQLVAIDATRGEGLWSTVLGDVPRSLSSDPARQRTACPVIWDDGLLIAATANGAVVAVDALTHAPRWAHRYPTTPRDALMRPREQNTNFQPDPWWDAWREARLQVVGDALVFVSPESQRLHVIDRRVGTPRWTIARDDALWLTGATETQVQVAGPHHVAAFQIENGTSVWRTAIADSGGRPLLMPTEI
ncbi:MAG TPA: PQQ-binding-like beta-propeller repeat protein, partial [Planctomycetaceae bacterium]|nr:PQQ-binding-like beta-propeller repeat protein [Planctomycetaceae bacterium]